MTDGELAAAFASTGASDAFDELVRRHVLMVFRTCRRVTGDHHEAEEATQAVFIALASHAPSLKSYRSVAGWLYSTAWNVARRKRTARDTRRLHEQRLIPATTSDMHVPLSGEELPELYRALRMLPLYTGAAGKLIGCPKVVRARLRPLIGPTLYRLNHRVYPT